MAEERARSYWTHQPPLPAGRTLVAVLDGSVAGTAEFHPNFGGPGSHIANAGFMVDPAYAGRGVGRALGEYVVAAAREEGFRAMQFNAVVSTNVNAIALWKSLGFTILATIPDGFRHPTLGFVGLHIMYRAL
jgi:GNAT superfamily N-acetyltransferase